ncbi:MAG: 3-isopropylmalate dehydrogenase [Acidobacteriota bacterium]|jgi:3-isopropylmalate dehydrogenase|nr:3-isopropylmalate dehydrogenase [Acidobacteriota bacterium]
MTENVKQAGNVRKICVLPGDGIGPEIVASALAVLKQVASDAGFAVELHEEAIGGVAIDAFGDPLPEATLRRSLESDAVLLGAVGGPKWDPNPPALKPETGLLGIRKALGLYGNLRPVKMLPTLVDCSTLKPETVSGVDFVVVRELTGGLYFGKPRGVEARDGVEVGFNNMVYSRPEIERIARKAFELARLRRRKVTSVDKANVLEVCQLWRKVVAEVAGEYPDVELEHILVDNCAMQLVLRPTRFDVLLTENMFGDILSDIGGVLTGSIGTLPSASVGDGPALYEPIHGSAPDIAGKDVANPVGTVNSVAMMFEHSFGRPDLARRINDAVCRVLEEGYRTADVAKAGTKTIGTKEFTARIQEKL